MMKRCEHNCHLCRNEWLGRCHGGLHYGKDVSLEGETDVPICEEYIYGGSKEHLIEIEKAQDLINKKRRFIDLDVLISQIEAHYDCDYGEQLINPADFLDLVNAQAIVLDNIEKEEV